MVEKCGLEDVSRCCKSLVLTYVGETFLVCMRMFAAKTVIAVRICNRGIRTEASGKFVH